MRDCNIKQRWSSFTIYRLIPNIWTLQTSQDSCSSDLTLSLVTSGARKRCEVEYFTTVWLKSRDWGDHVLRFIIICTGTSRAMCFCFILMKNIKVIFYIVSHGLPWLQKQWLDTHDINILQCSSLISFSIYIINILILWMALLQPQSEITDLGLCAGYLYNSTSSVSSRLYYCCCSTNLHNYNSCCGTDIISSAAY